MTKNRNKNKLTLVKEIEQLSKKYLKKTTDISALFMMDSKRNELKEEIYEIEKRLHYLFSISCEMKGY